MKTELNTIYYLSDGEHYFIVKPDKFSGQPLAKLYKGKLIDKPISLLTIGNKTHHDLINYFEAHVMRITNPVIKQREYVRKWYHVYDYCPECFARFDQHDMNCVECCPMKKESDFYEEKIKS